jgi:hypothetical protein
MKDDRFQNTIKQGLRKFVEDLLYSSARPPMIIRAKGEKEEDLKEVIRSLFTLQELKKGTFAFSMNVDSVFLYELGIVQEQFGNCSEEEAFFHLINFILLCDMIQRTDGAIQLYSSTKRNGFIADETPWSDIRSRGAISESQLH